MANELMDLIASMTLLAGVYLFMFGIQTFVIKDRRRLPHEAIRATVSMVLGLFIFALWVVWIGKPMVMNNTAVTKAAAANVGGENLKALLKELGQE
jgi:ABC-type phosphate transport system permease subunit